MNTKKLRNFAFCAREQMNLLSCTKEQIKSAFACGLMNAYAKHKGTEGVVYDDALVPQNILDTLSSDILSGEFVRVEDIGMLYQYFVNYDRAEAIDVISGNDIDGSMVSAATQVFTPDWIASYLTDNSLGKYFAANHGEAECIKHLPYYIHSREKLPDIKDTVSISFFDPCCGSGNILVYAFDVFMKMYICDGISPEVAAGFILKYNIYGADIDSTAVELASFSLMMKASEFDKNIFASGIRPNIHLLDDEDGIGSLGFSTDKNHITGKKFSVVCTNPPYLGRIGGNLKKYLNATAKPYSKDLFTAFMYRGLEYCREEGYMAYLTPNVWMYLSSHCPVRDLILDKKCLCLLMQMEKGSFFSEASVDLCAFVVKNKKESSEAIYIYPKGAIGMAGHKEALETITKSINSGVQSQNVYIRSSDSFDRLPGRIMAFYAPDNIGSLFDNIAVGDVFTVKQGMSTGNNKKFVRYWYEVPYEEIGFGMKTTEEACKSQKKWFPYNKGGKYRKWYGNNDYVVMYEDDGREMKEYTSKLPQGTWVRLKSRDYYFKKSVTWSFISSSHFGVRYSPEGSIFDVAGSSLFGEDLRYVLGFLSTKTAFYLLQLINPTMNYQIRDIKLLPYISDKKAKPEVEKLTDRCIELSRNDWNSYELSYEFATNPEVALSGGKLTVEEAVKQHIKNSQKAFDELKECETRLNGIFAKIYGTESITDICLTDKDITLKVPDEKTCLENLMSYIAGCAFGRFSPDRPGIISTKKKYLSYSAIEQYAEKFLEKEFCSPNKEYIEKTLGCDIHSYYRKHFLKKHYTAYRKRPLYTKKDTGIIYFESNT